MILFSVVIPMFAAIGGQTYANQATSCEVVENQETEQKESDDFNSSAILYGSVGLLTVGGAGSIVIANNNKKEKNVPSKVISNDIEDKDM